MSTLTPTRAPEPLVESDGDAMSLRDRLDHLVRVDHALANPSVVDVEEQVAHLPPGESLPQSKFKAGAWVRMRGAAAVNKAALDVCRKGIWPGTAYQVITVASKLFGKQDLVLRLDERVVIADAALFELTDAPIPGQDAELVQSAPTSPAATTGHALTVQSTDLLGGFSLPVEIGTLAVGAQFRVQDQLWTKVSMEGQDVNDQDQCWAVSDLLRNITLVHRTRLVLVNESLASAQGQHVAALREGKVLNSTRTHNAREDTSAGRGNAEP